MAKSKFRVVIPENPEKLLVLMKLVLEKHLQDGIDSPLNALVMDEYQSKVEAADGDQTLGSSLKKEGEKVIQSRNLNLGVAKGQKSNTIGTGLFHLKSIRDLLLGVYKGREKELGKWGFVVDDSPKSRSKTGSKDGTTTK